ncbi:hypothetical protein AS589_12100 [Empedobacter brevis]|uniref:DUF2971 domain-containing protein n=1 Tax=Empedobacter brevis TaxID=247 RepID=UPI00131F9FD0|nr:DUF2971 domain-containing protein [Empedobacter brevis]QHC85472.1 hypothetical protein AS589_12100 [Empedobacter brevis]
MTANYQTEMNEILSYFNKYNRKIAKDNAQQAYDDFISNFRNWKNVVGYMTHVDNEIKDGEREYGNVLLVFSVAISEINSITESVIDTLIKEIQEYEDKVKYMFDIKLALYLNLGLCWHKLGRLYDNMAIEAFKKYIYYQLTLSNHTSYSNLSSYAFRSCSKFLYQSLINETLNLSSPITFNDLFDCPIIELMNNEDETSKLIREAYLSGVRIACFVKNVKLPYSNNDNELPIINHKKNARDKKEYLNELMWSHYAGSHTGICIKYNLPSSLTTCDGEKDYVTYFKDIEYPSSLKKYSKQSSIKINEAFFVKGKSWKYENELRFLYYNPNNRDLHISIPIHNSIEAIYFGAKCSEKDKQTIKNILRDKKCISKKTQLIKGKSQDIIQEKDIEFYQMEMDKKVFGAIKAVRVSQENNVN